MIDEDVIFLSDNPVIADALEKAESVVCYKNHDRVLVHCHYRSNRDFDIVDDMITRAAEDEDVLIFHADCDDVPDYEKIKGNSDTLLVVDDFISPDKKNEKGVCYKETEPGIWVYSPLMWMEDKDLEEYRKVYLW